MTSGTLPLSASSLGRVLVTGPSSASLSNMCGGWTLTWQGTPGDTWFTFGTTILAGITAQLTGSGAEVVHHEGCDIRGNYDQADFDATIAAAASSDVVIVAIGESTYAELPGDISDALLPAGQLDLVRALIATGTPVVVVLVEGRPRLLGGAIDGAAAVISAMLPCVEGGQAIGEIIFGEVNPSGRLPYSYPLNPNDGPLQYWHFVSAKDSFQWPFGTGLSYSNFVYSNLRLSASTVTPDDTLTVTVNVRNEGPYDGKVSVQIFQRDHYRSVVPEAKMLKGFEKIFLENGQSTDVSFALDLEDWSFIGLDNTKTYEAGDFDVMIGNLKATFTLVF